MSPAMYIYIYIYIDIFVALDVYMHVASYFSKLHLWVFCETLAECMFSCKLQACIL